MSRTNNTVDRSLRSAFRDRLAAVDVDSTVVSRDALADTLETRLTEPAVASDLGDGVDLPAAIGTEPTLADLRAAATGITRARLGVASLGSIVVSSSPGLDGPVSLFPPKHVAILEAADIVADLETALELLAADFAAGANDVVFVTGPSSTGDMGELVVGVHGPAEMEVVIVE
ncbi:LUD domain-containing protein [Natronobiforma cellulositropha]|uniref:LUD domain-containing protein n=1 Tax=Natronobiforma cellulositropha TaxID=1679076 RepID=UPI0021D5782B|nr:LUD domain-containing protein [Natronobiforma cellulositropha]